MGCSIAIMYLFKSQKQTGCQLNQLHNSKSSLAEFPSPSPPVSSEEILYPVENFLDLEVQVSNDLSWSGHILSMLTTARST